MSDDKMTTGQYRALVAYMSFWKRFWPGLTLIQASDDIGISAPRSDVIEDLGKAGWEYDKKTETVRYTLDDLDVAAEPPA